MPCYLVISILLRDLALAKRSAEEIGLVEGRDYSIVNGAITMRDQTKAGLLKQRYGILQAEREARKKGVKSTRKVQEDGVIQLVLTR